VPLLLQRLIDYGKVGVLADLANLNTSQISIGDIITIRSEDAFSDYRRVLQGILRRLQDREGKFSDLETEFAVAAREEMAECDDRINQIDRGCLSSKRPADDRPGEEIAGKVGQQRQPTG
jgi:hypothetical protein